LSQTSDAQLVDAFVRERQDGAFVELVRRYQIPVFRSLELALTDPDDAEAVCETVFVVASQRLGEWDGKGTLREWLLELAEQLGRDRASAVDTEAPRFVDPAVYFKHSVHRALHSLAEEQRQLLLAVDLEGQSVEKVAEQRGESLERVTQSLGEARERFTAAINEQGAPATPPQGQRVEIGEVVDKRYRVEDLLGEGGMASVFRAEHINIKRKVALKTLHPTRQTQAMIRERFVREAEVLGRLAHPNFVSVSDFGVSSRGYSYLVMELLGGGALDGEISARGPLSPQRALGILIEVCEGLSHAHSLGIIHRDIKPANIVVLGDEPAPGFAKILDLGIATTEAEQALDAGGSLFGTPEYMAPEQILGQRIDGRVDLYALGITLFECLTGHVPFQGSSMQFVLAQQLTGQLPPLREERPDLPQLGALQGLLDACVAKDPAQRVRSAKALAEAARAVLARLGDDTTPRAAMPRREAERLRSATRAGAGKSRVWLALGLASVVVALACYFLLR
jgi:DNA-directed RNA polymerase specialized sigma24 family protein/tRNA A-37 threonylcarbamoyl transferase component Bud32